MSLDRVRAAKERGWRVMLVEYTTQRDPNSDELAYHVLVTPSGKPIDVSDKEGYGSMWGDYTEQEAWQRLPNEL